MTGGTILPPVRDFHKGRPAVVMLLLLAVLAQVSTAAAQRDSVRSPVGAADVAGTVAGGALYLVPHVVAIHHHPPACAPCDRARLAWFDRWAVALPRGTWANVSDVVLGGLALATWWDLAHQGRAGASATAASVQSASLAWGTTELLKAIVARKRPVLYTAQAPAAAGILDSQRSLPSGHTAAAFALAASYWLAASERGSRDWKAWAAMAAAAGVSALRVAAAKHFPSDVVVGAAVGTVSAIAVYQIRF